MARRESWHGLTSSGQQEDPVAATMPDSRLVRAKARLDRLDWWPRPVRIDNVRIVVTPWLFRLRPWRRFDGFATHRVIFLRHEDASEDLVTHELCHVWQMQHRPLRMPLSYLRTGYWANGYERQARTAASLTTPES
jgi:hypothetical protein